MNDDMSCHLKKVSRGPEHNLKNEVNLSDEDALKSKDGLKNEDTIKNKDKLRLKLCQAQVLLS